MKDESKKEQQIILNINEISFIVSRIYYKGKETPFSYIQELLEVYKRKFPNDLVTFESLKNSLSVSKIYRIDFDAFDRILYCRHNEYDDEMLIKIRGDDKDVRKSHEEKMYGRELCSNTHSNNKSYQKYGYSQNFLSSEGDTDNEYKEGMNLSISQNKKQDHSLSRSMYEDDCDELGEIKNVVAIKSKRNYKNDYSQKKYRNPYARTKKPVNSNPVALNTYEDARNFILKAIEKVPLFDVPSFNGIIVKTHGISFNYKLAPSKSPNPHRKTISEFLDGYDDFLKKIVIKNQMFFLRIDTGANFITNQRKILYKNLSDPKTRCIYIEILIVNMFMVPTTLESCIIEELFEHVYKVSIKKIIGLGNLFEYVKMYKPKNIRLKFKGRDYRFQCVPTYSSDFEYDSKNKIYEKVIYNEENICKFAVPEELKEKNNKNMSLFRNDVLDFIFPMKGSLIDSLIEKSGYNVPTIKQENIQMYRDIDIFEVLHDGVSMDPSWVLISENINNNDKRVYFDI